MEAAQLIHWLRQPETLDKESLVMLKEALDAYPCFTTLRMLYQKNLLELQDVRFSTELVRTAVSLPDRQRLFLFMEGRSADCLSGIESNKTVPCTDFSLIDRFLQQTADYTPNVDELMLENEEPPLADQVPAPVLDNDEVVDEFGLAGFSLDYLSFQREQNGQSDSAGSEESHSEPLHGHDLIDAFLKNGRLGEAVGATTETADLHKQVGSESANDLSEDEAVEALIDTLPEESFSEALAKIYLKQKRYDKALEIIKSLRLKYPEKNSYFADQIRFLEKLILLQKNN